MKNCWHIKLNGKRKRKCRKAERPKPGHASNILLPRQLNELLLLLRPLCCFTDCLPDCGSWSVALMLGQLVDCHRHLSAAMTTAAPVAAAATTMRVLSPSNSGTSTSTRTGTMTSTRPAPGPGNNDNTLPGRQHAQVERGINSGPSFGRQRKREKETETETLTAEYKWLHLHLRYATFPHSLAALPLVLASCAIKKCHCQQKQPCHEGGCPDNGHRNYTRTHTHKEKTDRVTCNTHTHTHTPGTGCSLLAS